MDKLPILVILFALSGCVAYPSKHLVSPEYIFSFKSLDAINVKIQVGIESGDVCNTGDSLEKVNGNFVSPKKYSWLKVAWAVPVTSSNNLYLCLTSSAGESYEWQTQVYYYGSLEPENKQFNCHLSSNGLVCYEQKHNQRSKANAK